VTDWFEEAKQFVQPHRKMMERLVFLFLRMRGREFRAELDQHKNSGGEVCLSFYIVSFSVLFAAIYVNPFTAPADIWSAVRSVGVSSTALMFASIGPIYLSIRLFGGAKCFWFVMNISAINGLIGGVLVWFTFIPGAYLSTQIVRDIEDVHAGHGTHTAFYRSWCEPVVHNIELLSEQIELNDMTGIDDLEEKLQSLPSQSPAGFAAIKQYYGRIQQLSPDQKARVLFLKSDIDRREQELVSGKDSPAVSYAMAHYWPLYLGIIAWLLAGIFFWIWSMRLIWQGIVDPSSGARFKRIATFRVVLGATLSAVLSWVFLDLNQGYSFSMDYYDLQSRTHNLEIQARNAELNCGRFDSKGMW
jgi:hypothetical protein